MQPRLIHPPHAQRPGALSFPLGTPRGRAFRALLRKPSPCLPIALREEKMAQLADTQHEGDQLLLDLLQSETGSK